MTTHRTIETITTAGWYRHEDGTFGRYYWQDGVVRLGAVATAEELQVTDDQIRALRTEANEHGDTEQADICSTALGGDRNCRQQCALVIRDNRIARRDEAPGV